MWWIWRTSWNSMGSQYHSAGTDVIRIKGVSHLHGTEYAVIPGSDRSRYVYVRSGSDQGRCDGENVIPKHLESITAKTSGDWL